MDREEATRALEVLRKVVTQARDDTALQNWGVIWMLHAITNGAGFVTTNVLIWEGYLEPPIYVALWGGILSFNLVSIFVLKKRRAGARSFVETQLWAIWTTFIGAVSLIAVLNHVMALRTFFLGPVIGVLAATCFSFMGSVMGTRWYIATAVFAAAAIAMGLLPDAQFVILGVVWGAMQFLGGAMLHRERRRQVAAGADRGPRLV